VVDPWFWWTAAGLAVTGATMVRLGAGRAPGIRGVLGLSLLALVAWLAGWLIGGRWTAAGALVLASLARTRAGLRGAVTLASAVAVAGAIVSLERPEAIAVLVGSCLIVVGDAIDRFGFPVVIVPMWHAAACVAVVALAPLGGPVASMLAAVVGVVWWRDAERAMFGRPGARAAILLVVIATIALIAGGYEGAPAMLFATVATFVPFCSDE
jgi:hypothetical protein